jgi:hypothetical protein
MRAARSGSQPGQPLVPAGRLPLRDPHVLAVDDDAVDDAHTKMPSDHHGLQPPTDSSAAIAPRLPPMIPMTRP